MIRMLAVALTVLTLAACEGAPGPMGPEGPRGPEGPPGPQGDAGPGTRIVYSGVLTELGGGGVGLPPEAGTEADPPSITCYASRDGGFWYVISTDFDGNQCFWGVGQGDRLTVAIRVVGGAGWLYQIVVVY